MASQRTIVLSASILLGCLILSFSFGPPAQGQAAVPPTSAGAYQIVVTPQPIGSDCTVVVFDPATGRAWNRSTNHAVGTWNDLGSPIKK